MNRLTPLISRRARSAASFPAAAARAPVELEEAVRWVEDARLFAFGWVAGLVVFGTLFA
jgi:hypothetical protein